MSKQRYALEVTPAMIDAAREVFDVRFFDVPLSKDDAKTFFTDVWCAMRDIQETDRKKNLHPDYIAPPDKYNVIEGNSIFHVRLATVDTFEQAKEIVTKCASYNDGLVSYGVYDENGKCLYIRPN